MEHIGLITTDPHLKAELKAWLQDLPGEFELIDLGPPATGDPSISAKTDEPSDEPDEKKNLKLVIFDSKSPMHLRQCRQDLKLDAIPWLAIGREEHAKNPHDDSIDGCEDLILLPLDRLVLLQKIELLLAGPKSITPSFLFLSKTELAIELAKPVQITHLSEVGCTISAQKPVASGVEGSLISRIFSGDGATAEPVEVRVITSNPFFDSSIASVDDRASTPKFEVKLRFFGLKQKQLAAIRKWLHGKHPGGFPEIQRSDKAPLNNFNVAMISPDKSQTSKLQSSLEQLAVVSATDYGGLNSFRSFLMKRELGKRGVRTATSKATPPWALPYSDSFIGPRPENSQPLMPRDLVTFHFRLSDGTEPNKIERFDPPLKSTERLLDSTVEAWLKDASLLLKGLSEIDRETLLEGIQWTSSQPLSKNETRFEFDFNVDEFFSTKLIIRILLLEEKTPVKPPLLSFSLESLPKENTDGNSASLSSSPHQETPFDAVMVDASLLQVDVKAKMIFLKDALETHKVKNSFGHTPPIVVFNANEGRFQAQDLRGTQVSQLLYDFNDRRFQAAMFISMSRPELWTSPQLEVADRKTELKAFLSRPAVASSVSEVSISIVGRSAMRLGTELLIMSPVWSQAPEGLWARLRCVTTEDSAYLHEFIFFGASDLVQKEVRKFTRAEYVKKKAQGQS